MQERLRELLIDVQKNSGIEFSGIGLIVYEQIDQIPIFPLRLNKPELAGLSVSEALSEISCTKSTYHDGFHLISKNWELTHVAQYFSPPITENIEVNYKRIFGSRYLTALFGSALPNVLISGMASTNFGVAIFKNGKEIYFSEQP